MARSSPKQESMLMSQNTWSCSTSLLTTHSALPPPSPTGSLNSSKLGGEPTIPWLKQHVPSSTPPPSQRWSNTAVTTSAAPTPLRSNKKTTCYRGLNIVWKRTGSTSDSPPSKGAWTSTTTSLPAATSCTAQTLVATTTVDQEVLPERAVMLLPEQAAELLP